MAKRPLIAIPARFSASASALRYAAEVSSRNLIEAVYRAGGEPLMMHPAGLSDPARDDEVADRLWWADGVLLPGGGDLAAQWSGQEDHPSQYDVDLVQDAFDLAVARVALARGLPLLAICRGTQVINVALGGTLIQDMDEQGGPVGHHRHHRHHVAVSPGTLAQSVIGDTVEASCYHHQALDGIGRGLVVTARAEEGVIEAVERRDEPSWFLGVQWHPEDRYTEDPKHLAIFESFVAAAARQRAR